MSSLRAIALALLLAVAAGARAGECVATLTDGSSLTGQLTSLDATALVLSVGGKPQTVERSRLRSLRPGADAPPSEDAMSKPGQALLIAEDGSRLCLSAIAIADGRLKADSAVGGAVALPVEGLRRLLVPRPQEKPADLELHRENLKVVPGDRDVALVNASGDDWVALAGIVTSYQMGALTLNYEGTPTPLENGSAPVIEFAQVAAKARPAAIGWLAAADGSRLAVVSIRARDGKWRVSTPSLGELELDPAKISAVAFESAGGVWLSDLPLARASHTPLFDVPQPHRLNRSAAGGELRLAGARYEHGLGLVARTQLNWALDGGYHTLSAAVGLDDAVRAGGATVTFSGDGKPLSEILRLDVAHPASPIKLDVTGVKSLVLLVEFLPDSGGVGARVNLCDPRLEK